MNTCVTSTTLSVFIQRAPAEVYAYISNPSNLPQWASGLGDGVERLGGHWIVHAKAGDLKLVFADQNDFGVADHWVTLPNGGEVYVPLRVLKNGSGSEVVFTLFRQPEMSDADYANDASLVQQDLHRLQRVLAR
jgi:uncharacterized protein YndB with AHSA1/START domain